MQLTRDAIQRMVNGSGGGAAGAGGSSEVSMSMLAGYATEQWVNENFVSIEFFNRLFTVHGEVTETDPESGEDVTTEVTVLPNDLDTLITNIEARFTLWTQQAISAMGLNDSGGGGGGGASTLADLLDVNISNLAANQVLYYNSTQQRWVNGYDVTTWLTSSDLTNYATKSWAQNEFATPGWVQQQGYLTSSAISDMATKTWVNQQISDMATKTWVNNQGYLTSSSISDMATKTWVNQQNFLTAITSEIVTTALGYTPVSNAVTWWGQSVSGGTVAGNMNDVGSIYMNSNIYMANNTGISAKDSNGSYKNLFTFNGSNVFAMGFEVRTSGYRTDIQGGNITFAVGTTRIEAGEWTSGGRFWVKEGTQGIRIGNGLITFDGTNFKISKTDGSAANLYALGAISALGLNASSGTDAATITTLLTSRINLENTNNYLTKSGLTTAAAFAISAGGNISLNTATVDTSGYVHTGRVYLSSSCYLYTDGSDLRMNLNGTAYKLTKTT